MRLINLIVIHCSDTPNGVAVTPRQIDAWHRQNGFRRTPEAIRASRGIHGAEPLECIGYHWVVSAEGNVLPGRSRQEIGAHVAGHNANSLGICMVGRNRFYMHQWLALSDIVCTLAYTLQDQLPATPDTQYLKYKPAPKLALTQFARQGIKVVGHRDLSPDHDGDGVVGPRDWLKTCPGFSVEQWLQNGMLPIKDHIYNPPSVHLADPNARAAAKW